MFYIADIFTISVQYGQRTELCQTLSKQSFYDFPEENMKALGDKHNVFFSDYDSSQLNATNVTSSSVIRQWTYQYCSMFHWYQSPANSTLQARSQVLKAENWPAYCERIFGRPFDQNTAVYVNLNLGNRNMTYATQVLYVNADEDPW